MTMHIATDDRIGSRADETELRQSLTLSPQQRTESLQRKIFQLRATSRLMQRSKLRSRIADMYRVRGTWSPSLRRRAAQLTAHGRQASLGTKSRFAALQQVGLLPIDPP
jgi:hypothetical protein